MNSVNSQKKTSLKKIANINVKSSKKAMNLSWKKVKGAQGYDIQISLNKKFKKDKKYNTKTYSVKTTKKKIKKLKTKKYYVRIRSYAKVSGTTYFSQWSKVKSVKVKGDEKSL